MSAIAQTYVREAQFDRTIQGIIVSCEDQASGKYKVKYQDSIWLAYSSNLDMTYSPGTGVYVLIPGNDMARNKTILGTVNELGEDYINYINNNENDYIQTGANFVKSNISQFGLCSYKTEQKVLYNVNSSNNLLNVDTIAAKQYLSKSKYIILRANFRTTLPEEQQKQGNYGLKIQIEFEDSNQSFIYNLDIDDMIGNPYLFYSALSQEAIFQLDGEKFKRIKKISIFDEKFTHQSNDKDNDIFISNIELIGANEITQKQRQGTYLQITCPQGYIFTSEDFDTSTRIASAKVMVKGKILSSSSNQIKFYWFKRDMSIDAGSSLYSPYGGKGWRCLNELRPGQNNNGNEKFKPGSETINILKTDVPIGRVEFQCVAVYNNNMFSNTFQMLNVNSQYLIEIVSNKEMVFYSDEDVILLTCNVKNRSDNTVINTNNLTYSWKEITENYNFNTLGNTKSITVSANSVRNFSTYCCSAYMSNDLLGTEQVTIFKKQESINRYVLSIINGTQLFNYDQAGNSPYNQQFTTNEQLAIPALTYSIIDTVTGEEISDDNTIQKRVKWIFPLKNSLLVEKDNDAIETHTYNQKKEFINIKNFVYGINNRYYINRTNNTIQLQVTIHDIKLKAETNFIFTKEGQLGTNGTGIACNIAAFKNGKAIPKSHWLINRACSSGYDLNWDTLKAELWQNGENIFSSNYTVGNTKVTWEILSKQDKSWYHFTSGPTEQYPNRQFQLTLINNLSNSSFQWASSDGWPANIIKLTVQYNGRKYYDFAPIVTTFYSDNYTDTITLDSNCGFKYVVYSQDGENPKYDNESPFKITIDSDSAQTWNWSMVGSIYTGEYYSQISGNLTEDLFATYPEEEDLIEGIEQRIFLKPSSTYDSRCITNALMGKFGSSKFIHIPIHFMLNKYGHKNLNDWDGISIKIDNQKNYILSPQIGAGIKNDDNTFTGLLMGSVEDLSNNNVEVGLLGYYHGARTIFLDSETGRAEFGKQGEGQIIIDPTSGHAKIYGGAYVEKTQNNNGSGMLIDLTTPEIKFGNGNFYVNPEGSLIAKEGHLGPWTLDENSLYYGFPGYYTSHTLGDKQCIYLGVTGFSISDKLIYDINKKSLTLKVSSLSIGDRPLDDNRNTYYTTYIPRLANYPASEWTSYGARAVHRGDRCYNKKTGKAYSFIQKSNGIKIKFSDNSKTYNSNDYVQIFFQYPKNGGNESKKIYSLIEKLSGTGISGKEVIIPNDNFYLYWHTNSVYDSEYGFNISSVDSQNDILIIDYKEDSLPFDQQIIQMSANVYPQSAHNGYGNNIDQLYHCTKSGLNISSSFSWEQIQDEDIVKALEGGKTATNYLYYTTERMINGVDYSGLYISENAYTDSTNLSGRTGANLRLTNSGIEICNGAKVLTKYGANSINFYDYFHNDPIATIGTEGLYFKMGKIELGTKFKVNTDGTLQASGAVISGAITASSLALSDTLTIGNTNSQTYFKLSTNGEMTSSGGKIITSKKTDFWENGTQVIRYQQIVMDDSIISGYYGHSFNYSYNTKCGMLDLSANYDTDSGGEANVALWALKNLRLQARQAVKIESDSLFSISASSLSINGQLGASETWAAVPTALQQTEDGKYIISAFRWCHLRNGILTTSS